MDEGQAVSVAGAGEGGGVRITRGGLRRFLTFRANEVFGFDARSSPLAAFLHWKGAVSPFVERDWYAEDVEFSAVAHLTYKGPRTRLPKWAVAYNDAVDGEPGLSLSAHRALQILDGSERGRA